MAAITLQNGLISYYGNPVGYTEKDAAVVDSSFQKEELTAWLQSRSLSPRWTDGVLERLLAGEQPVESHEADAPLKNVRIWQLRPDADVRMKFIGLDELERQFGQPCRSQYRVAYDGQLGTNDLAGIEQRCSDNPPPGYKGHLLSMSDVVELYDGHGSEFHYVDRTAFRQIEFAPEQQEQDVGMTMSQSF